MERVGQNVGSSWYICPNLTHNKVAVGLTAAVTLGLMALGYQQHGSSFIDAWRPLSLTSDSAGNFKMPDSCYVTLPGGVVISPVIFSTLTALATAAVAHLYNRA